MGRGGIPLEGADVRRQPRQFYTPQEVGNMTGFSAQFIRNEIRAGQLEAVYVKPPGRKVGRWMITVSVAVAYAGRLGMGRTS